MAKKKAVACDGECQAYKKLKVEVHEPEIEGESWDDEDDADWQDELITELIEENDKYMVQIEAGNRSRAILSKYLRYSILWSMFVTVALAVCAIF